MSEDNQNDNGFAPDDDIDVPISLHIEEFFLRLLIVFSIGLAIALVLLPISEDVIQFLWQSHIPNPDDNRPVVYSPLSVFMMRIQVIFLFSLVIVFPALIYQSYKFMEPGLYEVEKKYFKISTLSSFALSSIGILIGQFVVLPIMFFYFTSYAQSVVEISFGLQQTVGLMLIIVIYIIIIFQMPILISLAVLLGVVSRDWIRNRRLLFWFFFFGIAFLSSPDPTGMAPLIIGVIMLILFELSLFGAKYLPESERTE